MGYIKRLTKMMNVILVDDHLIIAEAIGIFLTQNTEFNFMRHFNDVQSCKEALLALHNNNQSMTIDIVILDVSLPDQNGIDLCKWIKANYPNIKIVFFSMYFDELIIGRSIKAGADGYLTKNEGLFEIEKALQAVMLGNSYYSHEIEQILLKRHKNIHVNDLPILTAREKEVLQLLVKGFPSKEIADKLFVSVKTIHFHRSNLLSKFDARNMAELTNEAIAFGLV